MRILYYAALAAFTVLPIIARAKAGEAGPFDGTRNSMEDIDAALKAAKLRGNDARVLLVIGSNQCHDSLALTERFEDCKLAEVIKAHYELIYVDAGHRVRTLTIANRFGLNSLNGSPAVLILSAEGVLLNADTALTWTNAASRTPDEILTYFTAYAEGEILH